MMMAPKWHLRGVDWNAHHKAACGLESPARSTTRPDEVTCQSCQRTVAMADAVARATRKPRR